MPPIAVKLADTGAVRFVSREHFDFVRQITALCQIARRTRSHNIVPRRVAALGARSDMIKRKIVMGPAVLASEPIPQEYVEPGESRRA